METASEIKFKVYAVIEISYADLLWIAVLCAGEFVHGFASSGETILRLRERITAQRTTN